MGNGSRRNGGRCPAYLEERGFSSFDDGPSASEGVLPVLLDMLMPSDRAYGRLGPR